MKGTIIKRFVGKGNWYILGEDGNEYFLGFKQCVNKEKYFKEGVAVTFDVKDTGKQRLEAWNCVAEKPPKPPITNANRIRNMTDEELAHWLEDHLCHAFCPDFNVDIDPVTKECLWNDGNCWMCILDWLKQEAD